MDKRIAKDPSRVHDARYNTASNIEYRIRLREYFKKSIGTEVEKLENFPKYVPRQSITRFLSRYEIFKRVLNVPGCIVECGVFLGGGLMSFAHFSAIFEPLNVQRKIIGFDTFSGFVGVSKEDEATSGKSTFTHKGGLAADSYADLLQCISLYDSNRFLNQFEKFSLVKGDIGLTVPKYVKENPHTIVSLLYLDADLYEPTKVAIENFAPRIPKGGIIVFDELCTDIWPGETLAMMETIGIRNLRIERFPFDTFISFAVVE